MKVVKEHQPTVVPGLFFALLLLFSQRLSEFLCEIPHAQDRFSPS